MLTLSYLATSVLVMTCLLAIFVLGWWVGRRSPALEAGRRGFANGEQYGRAMARAEMLGLPGARNAGGSHRWVHNVGRAPVPDPRIPGEYRQR